MVLIDAPGAHSNLFVRTDNENADANTGKYGVSPVDLPSASRRPVRSVGVGR